MAEEPVVDLDHSEVVSKVIPHVTLGTGDLGFVVFGVEIDPAHAVPFAFFAFLAAFRASFFRAFAAASNQPMTSFSISRLRRSSIPTIEPSSPTSTFTPGTRSGIVYAQPLFLWPGTLNDRTPIAGLSSILMISRLKPRSLSMRR